MKSYQKHIIMAGRTTGVLAVVAGLAGAGLLVAYWVIPYLPISFTGIHIVDDSMGLGAENAPIVTFWVTVVGALSLLTGYVVRMGYLKALWALAVILPVLTVLGLFSIGLFIAPFALLVVVSAILLTIGSRDEIPSREVLLKRP